MPFNIELMNKAGSTRDVAIKIQVVKRTINFYFIGNKESAIIVRENWQHLSEHFAAKLPDCGSRENIFIANGIHHLKKEHTSSMERTYIHMHLSFLKEITPERLSLYMYEMYEHQKTHPDAQYQFFQGRDEVENIIKAFSIHYYSYKGSSIESEFNKSAKLTSKEKIEHEKVVEEKMTVNSSIKEIEKLLIASILSKGHPIFGNAPHHVQVFEQLKEADTDNLDCSIM